MTDSNAAVAPAQKKQLDSEAVILINGHRISTAMSMTIRVALESLAVDLTENSLGDDEHGRAMRGLYLQRINEIRPILYAHHNPEKNHEGK